jgi:RNA-directed DNA polymerase
MTATPEPKDKLDAMTTPPAALAAGWDATANGPEGENLDWQTIDWPAAEETVRRLRQRIFTASKAGNLKKVRNLQKLMLRSHANTLISVRRVTEINAGRKTAGVDGEVALFPEARAELAGWVQRQAKPWTARPVKRVFIPKANGKQRPLGIPVLVDRVLQARVVNALEPEWEARFEPKSYGFRPGRGCQDAIQAIYKTVKGRDPKRRWALDADLTAAFDRIDHDHLVGMLGTFPGNGLVRQWLKAGVVDKGRFAPTEEGTPQGGVVSPLLLNVALHGLEKAAGVRYRSAIGVEPERTARDSPVLIRYADDLVVFCHSRGQAEQIKVALAAWLAPRGLVFNEDKTRIVVLDEGLDFLGFNVRRYGGKLLIKPSKAALRRIRERLRAEMRALRGANAEAVLQRLNPIIRGWSAYYRHVVSSKAFHALDSYLWRLTYKWAKYRHSNKSKRWVTSRYYGMFNTSRQDRWVFGDRDSGAYLLKFGWTKIVRHQMVRSDASPDDPAMADYWADRRRRGRPPLDRTRLRLLMAQQGRCPLCADLLLHADHEPASPREWEQWLTAIRKAVRLNAITDYQRHGTSDDAANSVHLIHAWCERRLQAAHRGPAPAAARNPSGLA